MVFEGVTREPPRASREHRDSRWTVGELLQWTTEKLESLGIPDARTDAQHLLAHALGCSRMDLYVRFHELLTAEARTGFRTLVRRRLAREPVAYIEGRRGFHALDLELVVDGRVLIPRPDSELLVDWILEDRPEEPPLTIVDVGTGSGALALAIKHGRPGWHVQAVDVSADALSVARENAAAHDLEVEFRRADLLEGAVAPTGGFDVIAANLPYIPSGDIETLAPEVRDFEPRLALDGGDDGLRLIDRLLGQVVEGSLLAPGGAVYLEFGVGQREDVVALALGHGLSAEVREDLGRIPRVARVCADGPTLPPPVPTEV